MKIILLILLSILLLSCSRILLTKDKFDNVEIGMNIQEVKDILGEPAIAKQMADSTKVFFYYRHHDFWATNYSDVYFDKEGYVYLAVYSVSD